MKRSYGLLLAGMLAVGLLMVWAGHVRRTSPGFVNSAAVPETERVVITVRGSSVDPASVVVSKNTHVKLRVLNAGAGTARITLGGYKDHFPAVSLQAGEAIEREFTADRPGEDFAWLLNGEPVGRFQVSGSHLVEGHR